MRTRHVPSHTATDPTADDSLTFVVFGQVVTAPKAAPGLHLVATPIGNLGDITLRALETLAGVDIVACEDTRVTRRLIERYGITAVLKPYHEHNAATARPKILERLAQGASIALVSDAGRFAGSNVRSGGASHDERTEARDGAIFLHDGTLASSLTLLDEGFRTFCEANRLGFEEAWDVVSGTIARALRLAGKGAVREGADADLTILERDGRVAGTMVAGRFAYRAF